MQPLSELKDLDAEAAPGADRDHPEDLKRRSLILSAIPKRDYKAALDIGCGEGFLTRGLPAEKVTGADGSESSIHRARALPENSECEFLHANLLELPNRCEGNFDLILISELVYRQNFGDNLSGVLRAVDRLLGPDGILVTSHIDAHYQARFPYLMLDFSMFSYREHEQRLEVYIK